MEKLAKATGASIVSKVSELSTEDVGAAGLVEERKIGDDSLTFVTGCKNAKAVSIFMRGGTEHVLDEIERSLDDALNVVAVAVEDGRIVDRGRRGRLQSSRSTCVTRPPRSAAASSWRSRRSRRPSSRSRAPSRRTRASTRSTS